MTVNGQALTLQAEISLGEFLKQQGYDLQTVAVEKNGGIVPKKDFAAEPLVDTDTLEVVCFVGGG